ncbi:allantoicase [Actinomadura madurae]|uniref:allantoicase n=1 Tax=Actinomadura madurae TaxID=1993 RepID=UPI003999B075
MSGTPAFTLLPDLASRALAGGVVAVSDELFAERENLIKPERAEPSSAFGNKGKVYDGWETRRRRGPGHDWAIVRLGVPGVVHGVDVDTAWFTGNYPPFVSVEAAAVEGYPAIDALLAAEWVTLLGRTGIAGDTRNRFAIDNGHGFTHVRLSIYPDGGVARFRVHGVPLPDPRLMSGTIDLAAIEHGGQILDCSNRFYSAPDQLLLPGRATTMGDGWENARRRDDGNDHVTVRLGAAGRVRRVEVDTSYFVGNAPGWASVTGFAGDGAVVELVPKTRLQPDTRHLFRIDAEPAVDRVRLDVYPDGGVARLRVHGEMTRSAHADALAHWLDALPPSAAGHVLAKAGLDHDAIAERPLSDAVIDALLKR